SGGTTAGGICRGEVSDPQYLGPDGQSARGDIAPAVARSGGAGGALERALRRDGGGAARDAGVAPAGAAAGGGVCRVVIPVPAARLARGRPARRVGALCRAGGRA